MGVLRRRSPWVSQPQVNRQIDLANPLTRGLIFADVPSFRPVNVVSGVGPTYDLQFVGGGKYASEVLWVSNGATDKRRQYAAPVSSGNITLLTIVVPNSVASDQVALGIFKTTGSGVGHYLQLTASGTTFSAVSTDANNWNMASGGTVVAGRRCVLAGTFTSGGGRALYVNGVKLNSSATARTPTGFDAVVIGAYYTGGSTFAYLNGGVALSLAWSRVLTDAEILSVSNNPWQLFAP